jgi:hypothetical protein
LYLLRVEGDTCIVLRPLIVCDVGSLFYMCLDLFVRSFFCRFLRMFVFFWGVDPILWPVWIWIPLVLSNSSNFLLINGEGLIMMLNQNQLSFPVPIKQIIKKWLSNIGFHNFTSLWYIPWVSPLTCWITFNSNIHWSKVTTTSLVSATTLHYIAFNKIL